MNLIFDFDGVIADSEKAYNYSLYSALKKAGFKYPLKQICKHTMFQYYETIGILAKRRRSYVTKLMIKFLLEQMKKGNYLFEGAKDALHFIAKRHKLFVVSNSYQVILEECAKFYGLKFVEMVGRSRKFRKKENAVCYLVKKFKMQKGITAYVGDSTSDIALAQDLGLRAIAVSSGWNSKEELQKKKPEKLYASIKDFACDLG